MKQGWLHSRSTRDHCVSSLLEKKKVATQMHQEQSEPGICSTNSFFHLTHGLAFHKEKGTGVSWFLLIS